MKGKIWAEDQQVGEFIFDGGVAKLDLSPLVVDIAKKQTQARVVATLGARIIGHGVLRLDNPLVSKGRVYSDRGIFVSTAKPKEALKKTLG